jgi:hypothetical protein
MACALPFFGCATLAVATAPGKVAEPDSSPEAKVADATFWATFHGGQYDKIGAALEKLEIAYLAHPNDPKTAAHIGFMHMWRLSESARQDVLSPSITDDLALARRYFDEAVRLEPHDARYRGFLAGAILAEGKIHHDEKLTRTGFFAMNDAVSAWPEFNLFTRGYVMSRLPADDARYAAAVEDQWDNLDACTDGAHVDRSTADFSPYLKLERHEGRKRACWSSWIAPHNFEGFFLNMGDMIIKAGDPTVARHVYAQAKLAKAYPSWPYREVLDRRIAQADENVALFRAPRAQDKERRVMIETAFSCTGCHQE